MNDQPADLAEQLAEMTRLRDNALRAAAHADQSIHIDLEGILADGLHGQWGGDHAPEDLIQAIIGIVRPVIAHAVKRAEEAEGATERVRILAQQAERTGCGAGWDLNPAAVLTALDPPARDDDLPAVRAFAAAHDPRKEG